MELRDTRMSNRVKLALGRAGIYTVEELRKTPYIKLTNIRCIGEKALKEIREILKDYN